jgi:hypothetical protein
MGWREPRRARKLAEISKYLDSYTIMFSLNQETPILDNYQAADVVALQAAAGATIVMRVALEARQQNIRNHVDSSDACETFKDIIAHGGIEMFGLKIVGVHATELHLNELRANFANHVDTNNSGIVIFHKNPSCPRDKSKDLPALHNKPLRCPVLYVQGPIGMLLEIMPAAAHYENDLIENDRTPLDSRLYAGNS